MSIAAVPRRRSVLGLLAGLGVVLALVPGLLLGRGMERGQASEPALMQDLLVQRGLVELPEGAGPHGGHG